MFLKQLVIARNNPIGMWEYEIFQYQTATEEQGLKCFCATIKGQNETSVL